MWVKKILVRKLLVQNNLGLIKCLVQIKLDQKKFGFQNILCKKKRSKAEYVQRQVLSRDVQVLFFRSSSLLRSF